MRPSKIRVAKYEHSATSKWVVEGLRNNAGKRSRRFFRTKAEADHFARDSLAERRQFGSSSAALPADLRLSAINCAEKLKPYGKTLEEATEALIKSLKVVPTKLSINQLVSEYLETKRSKGLSASHKLDMSSGYKIYLVFVLTALSVLGSIAWKLGILDLLIDTYYVPPSEWNVF